MTNTLQERFDKFIEEHPEAWEQFVKRTNQIIARGITHYSAKAIIEILRFHSLVDGRDKEPWKINNDYTAYFARKWQQEYPEHADFFETRTLKSAA